jgi:hypothetical protein
MGRPKPTIIATSEEYFGETWELLHAERTYVITYQGQPVNIRAMLEGLGTVTKKYKKVAYTNLGSCQAQIKRLNKIFNTDQFSYVVWPA